MWLVCGGMWWYVVVCGWYVVVCGWYVVVCGGMWWYVEVCGGMWWYVVVCAKQCHPALYLHFLQENLGSDAQRHVAALTLLIAFMQLYLLLVRVVPNTPIPIYINMFTTVLKTYVFILLSYLAFIISFAYSFFLIFNAKYDKNKGDSFFTTVKLSSHHHKFDTRCFLTQKLES